ncbi:winged helix-turn-helix transcriptional regulator [Streptomyces sp. 021-4]|uniref:winged helix-turn-helix transcriptional regulator n=1 Tax=Streptomyces sp. 021-4 TaxID=2789260 RepID=UPI0039F52E54
MKVLLTGLGGPSGEAVACLPERGFTILRGQRIDQLRSLGHRPDVILLACEGIDDAALIHCERLRAFSEAPIVATVRHTTVQAWMRGRAAGIDDFLVTPFGLDELVARLWVAVGPARRPGAAPGSTHIVYGPLRVAEQSRAVFVHGTRVELRPKEYQLLVVLARRAGQALSREHLISRLWPAGGDRAERSLEVQVAALRSKLAVPGLIATVRGVGYRLISQESYLSLEQD